VFTAREFGMCLQQESSRVAPVHTRGEHGEREGKHLAISTAIIYSTHRHSSLLPWSIWGRGAGHVEAIAGVEVKDSLVDPRTPRACARPSPHRSFLLLLSQKEGHVEPHGAKARRPSWASVEP